MSSDQIVFENAVEDLFKSLMEVTRKHKLSPVLVNLLVHTVAHTMDHVMLAEISGPSKEAITN